MWPHISLIHLPTLATIPLLPHPRLLSNFSKMPSPVPTRPPLLNTIPFISTSTPRCARQHALAHQPRRRARVCALGHPRTAMVPRLRARHQATQYARRELQKSSNESCIHTHGRRSIWLRRCRQHPGLPRSSGCYTILCGANAILLPYQYNRLLVHLRSSRHLWNNLPCGRNATDLRSKLPLPDSVDGSSSCCLFIHIEGFQATSMDLVSTHSCPKHAPGRPKCS